MVELHTRLLIWRADTPIPSNDVFKPFHWETPFTFSFWSYVVKVWREKDLMTVRRTFWCDKRKMKPPLFLDEHKMCWRQTPGIPQKYITLKVAQCGWKQDRICIHMHEYRDSWCGTTWHVAVRLGWVITVGLSLKSHRCVCCPVFLLSAHTAQPWTASFNTINIILFTHLLTWWYASGGKFTSVQHGNPPEHEYHENMELSVVISLNCSVTESDWLCNIQL